MLLDVDWEDWTFCLVKEEFFNIIQGLNKEIAPIYDPSLFVLAEIYTESRIADFYTQTGIKCTYKIHCDINFNKKYSFEGEIFFEVSPGKKCSIWCGV